MAQHDVVLFGATGFVGRLVAEYLAQHAPQLRVGVAGRDETRLRKVIQHLADLGYQQVSGWRVLVADAFDAEALADLAQSTRVVIATVGPYYRYGDALVAACAAAGTDYVDLCGEVLFMLQCIERYGVVAQRSGARIVHACGFDSVPSDLGMFLVQDAAGEPIVDATMLVKMRGGLSGGTVDSMREQFSTTGEDAQLRRIAEDPFVLLPDMQVPAGHRAEPDIQIKRLDGLGWAGGVGGPFIMAGCNSRVVRRSHALRAADGTDCTDWFAYREMMDMGTGLRAVLRTVGLSAMLGLFAFSLAGPRRRKLFARWLPKPGEGPSTEERESGFFRTTTYGVTASGRQLVAELALSADPGYKGTALMLSEAALCLLEHPSDARGGVLTPSTALGMGYVQRLRAAGMRIEVRDEAKPSGG